MCGVYVVGTTKVCVDEAKLIPAIQQYLDNLVTTLEGLAGTRDKYIITQRGNAIKVLSSLRRINEIAADATIPTAYATYAETFAGVAGDVAKNFTAIVAGFDTYQSDRATCIDALVQSQGALMCNAFIEGTTTGMTKTTGSEAATFSDAFVTQLSAKCYAYIQDSATQSSVIIAALYGDGLSSLVTALEKLIDGDATAATEAFLAAWTEFAKVSMSATSAEQPVEIPTSCTSQAACITWIDSIFTATGLLTNSKAILGGDVPTLTFTSRVLKEEGSQRRLASGGMSVDLSKYAFTTGFEKNPGSVDNTENANSALRNGIVACAVAALAMLF
jgi:hypothetical protein